MVDSIHYKMRRVFFCEGEMIYDSLELKKNAELRTKNKKNTSMYDNYNEFGLDNDNVWIRKLR